MSKQTSVVKTLVSDEVADDFVRFARQHGYSSTSDCLRELIMVSLYGTEHLTSVYANRIAALGRTVSETGTHGAIGVPEKKGRA